MLRLFLSVVAPFMVLSFCLASAAPAGPWPYPPAARGEVVEAYHGVPVADPYRWLEDLDSPATQAWVEAQSRLTESVLSQLPQRELLRERLIRLWNYPRFGLPWKTGGHYFFTKNDGLQNQSVLYVQDTLSAEPRVALDPNAFSAAGTVALTALAVSPDGQWLAYGTTTAGSDWNEFRVRNLMTGEETEDLIRWVKFSGLAWTKDSRGFFYSRYPEPPSEAGNARTFSGLAYQKVYYHRLGTPQAEDVLIAEAPDNPHWFLQAGVTEDGRYAVLTLRRGSSGENLLRCIDLGDPLKPEVRNPIRDLVGEWRAQHAVIGHVDGIFYVETTLDAARKRIVAIDPAKPAPEHWRTVVPESDEVIDSSGIVGGRLVVRSMRDASSRLRIHGLDGALLREVPLPGLGSVSGFRGRADEAELFYEFSSFTTPGVIFRHDLDSGESHAFKLAEGMFDPAAYVTTQVFYTSKDGTRVPMFITHKRGLTLDGTAPTLLHAYGGFNLAQRPAFSVFNHAWLEMGGVYALANVRGGGEYGREWHQAGTRERKQTVFDDYIAAAEWLCAQGYTAPARLVLSGRSNGGLLVGAVLNQRPDLARVAFPAVGVMDMLRFHRFTVGHSWTGDYGSSDEAEGFRYLYAYSPVHNVRAGVAYPAVLVTTADHDDRVHPGHSFKYTAQLQAVAANGPGSLPVLVRIERQAGHGAGKPTAKQIEEAADKLAFAAYFLGLAVE